MTTSISSDTTLTYPAEDLWVELVCVVTACIQENLVDSRLVTYELMTLRDKKNDSTRSHDVTHLDAWLKECQRLLAYYAALLKQKQRAQSTGSSFSQLALMRLQRARSL